MSRCLNCNSETTNNFCSVCGQKVSTHRFSLKHFFLHDLIHGVFHLDKGFPFTVKELYTRPGHSIREYIQGKRTNYFNYFTLLIIMIAIAHFIGKIPKVSSYDIQMQDKGTMASHTKMIKEYAKLILLTTIPLFALASFVVFRKSKLNYTEHLVMAMYFTSAILSFHMFPLLVPIFTTDLNQIMLVRQIAILFEFAYYFWFFYQFFSTYNYTKTGLIVRCFITIFLMLLLTGVVNYIVSEIGLMYFNNKH